MTSSNTSMTAAWLCVGLLWFVACLNYLDRIVLTTMRSSLTDAIPMTDAQFGLLTTVFYGFTERLVRSQDFSLIVTAVGM